MAEQKIVSKEICVLFLGMVIASVPGFMMVPYSVNPFDEPYQILNALDWENSVYSPLSSWMAHYIGEPVHWKYIAFRYLSKTLQFLTLLVSGLYAMKITSFPSRVRVIAWLATLFMLCDYNVHYLYGWDNWTALFVSISLIATLQFLRSRNPLLILFLSLITAITSLVRIPNLCIIPITAVVISVSEYRGSQSRRRMIVSGLVYLVLTMAVCICIISLLYGSVNNYAEAFKQNRIMAHTVPEMINPQIRGFIMILLYALLTYLAYCGLKRWGKLKNLSLLLTGLTAIVFYCSLLYSRGEIFGNSDAAVLGINLLLMYVIWKEAKKRKDYILWFSVFVMLLFSVVPSVGSNGGLTKSLSWPLLPLIVAFSPIPSIARERKLTGYAWIIAFGALTITRLFQPSFLDGSFASLSFKIKNTDTVFDGMITNQTRGKHITEVASQVRPYLEAGYEVIALRQGNDYLWEYLILNRNKYQSHLFGNWYAFNDRDYVKSIIIDVKTSRRPVLVMYMQWKNDKVHSMHDALERNMTCVLDAPGYSFWTYQPQLGKNDN